MWRRDTVEMPTSLTAFIRSQNCPRGRVPSSKRFNEKKIPADSDARLRLESNVLT